MKRMVAILMCSLWIIAGCSSGYKLTPGAGASAVSGIPNAARAESVGVSVVVEAQAWSGRPEILQRVTPVRVTIENKSGKVLRIRYDEFTLKGKKVYAALPPYQIQGTISAPVLIHGYPPIISPDFDFQGFSVAPYCAPLYPRIPVWQFDFAFNPGYYDQYYTIWAQTRLPTRDMLRQVLPDGAVDNGGHVSGFIYFQKVKSDETAVDFSLQLVDATNGEAVGTVTVPFQVIHK